VQRTIEGICRYSVQSHFLLACLLISIVIIVVFYINILQNEDDYFCEEIMYLALFVWWFVGTISLEVAEKFF